ncbi:hypothetical protein DFH28DRAFT_925426 [Melampsora americana]|nr:hypothetical protein DFH28DRAFT_925426 [Melampsora americana]
MWHLQKVNGGASKFEQVIMHYRAQKRIKMVWILNNKLKMKSASVSFSLLMTDKCRDIYPLGEFSLEPLTLGVVAEIHLRFGADTERYIPGSILCLIIHSSQSPDAMIVIMIRSYCQDTDDRSEMPTSDAIVNLAKSSLGINNKIRDQSSVRLIDDRKESQYLKDNKIRDQSSVRLIDDRKESQSKEKKIVRILDNEFDALQKRKN